MQHDIILQGIAALVVCWKAQLCAPCKLSHVSVLLIQPAEDKTVAEQNSSCPSAAAAAEQFWPNPGTGPAWYTYKLYVCYMT